MSFKTPLHENHVFLGARMVNFHGWDMPLHYGSQLEEHHAVRQHSGVFDVSHMTIIDVLGAGGRQFLRKLLTNDVDRLQQRGQALYSCMCDEHGGILDDLIVYQRNPDNYRIILNSATRDRVLPWIREKINGFSAGLQERTELSMLAVQGPEAIRLTCSLLSAEQAEAVALLKPFESIDQDDYFFARTGYTGEDGLEIILPETKIKTLWHALIEAGVKPAGLAARDTLRMEAGLLLYGQDMDETTTPLETGLAWTVQFEPLDRDFIGMGALLSQKQQGIKRKLVGLTLESKGIMRHGQTVFVADHPTGLITSGTYSPTLGYSIALARVPHDAEDTVFVDIRGTQHLAHVTKPRFVKHGKAL
ncbi:MAG: glycine cleavage system aminomethyltransferase GcvT [Legionellaceae bacterium]